MKKFIGQTQGWINWCVLVLGWGARYQSLGSGSNPTKQTLELRSKPQGDHMGFKLPKRHFAPLKIYERRTVTSKQPSWALES